MNQTNSACRRTHSHTEAHSHLPTRTSTRVKKNVVNRLARAIGHLERSSAWSRTTATVPRVLIQIAAVRAAIENTGKVIPGPYPALHRRRRGGEGDDQAIASLCSNT